MTLLRRCVALLLLLLVAWPLYGLVAVRGAGPAVDQTLRLGSLYYANLWLSLLVSAAAALLCSWFVPTELVGRLWNRAERALLGASAVRFAALLGALAGLVSMWVSVGVLERRPALLDGVAQLVHARYFAAGMLAGPPLIDSAFWQFQFMVATERGWVSQYPPGFAVVLGVGERLGAAWLVGPVLLALAVFVATLLAERVLPEDRTVARVGAALTAVSPVLAFHAGAYMSHVLALLLAVVALYAAVRAASGSWGWALAAGAALGGVFATRPYTALIFGVVACAILMIGAPGRERPSRAAWSSRLGGLPLGAAPFVALVLLYNRHFFGAALLFGYEASEGPGHRLGFHVDPWGNAYGGIEALGYTSADLLGLNAELLQAPVPIVLLIGVYALTAVRLGAGTRLVALWALLPLAAHALYWHHDLFMGPRLLYESLPSWCLLTAVAAAATLRALDEQRLPLRGFITRSGLAGAFALALVVAVAYAGPRKLSSYASEAAASGMSMAAPTVDRPSLVFVHGSWEDRLAARLAGAGMRVDSIRAALRGHSSCELEHQLDAVERGGGKLSLRPERAGDLRELRMPSGSVIRAYSDETLDSVCERQAASDFQGIVAPPPLLWQGDLPGLGSSGAMFVRDLGPERNQRLIARFPEREPRLLVRRDGTVRVLPYETGTAELWSAPPPSAPSTP